MPKCKGIFQAYGMTETSLGATQDSDEEHVPRKPGACGYPVSGVKIKVKLQYENTFKWDRRRYFPKKGAIKFLLELDRVGNCCLRSILKQ